MKRIKLLGIILITLVVLVGCSVGGDKTRKLSCTNSEDVTGLIMTQMVDITFKGDKATKMKLTLKNQVTDEDLKKQWDLIVKSFDELYNKEKLGKGIKLSTKADKKSYTHTIIIDVDVTKATREDLYTHGIDGIVDTTNTYAEVKKEAEKSGFNCK